MSMGRYLIWTVGHQWILQDTGQRHNRVWHWHILLSRCLSGCWTAAWNSAVLCGFLLAAPARCAWLYRVGWTLGLFSISALTRCSCPLSHSTEAFAIHCFVCNMLKSQWACSHLIQWNTAVIGELKLKWLLNNHTPAFSLVHQPCAL